MSGQSATWVRVVGTGAVLMLNWLALKVQHPLEGPVVLTLDTGHGLHLADLPVIAGAVWLLRRLWS